ncbi:unnamed protein product (mitochondrion) [Plasmodiophora brassicae]|uniref:PPM-type phosphatase domain-containing protein n=1 Tax=Plasmodiophora brassicae TaxID=37360 RepID=A0A0G4IPM2_PLABS|nr:hypothetical protein PBRA_005771 [Plasmodiophora brassicae]SPR01142.1 unnamed protein product [Plasmodiophora brassicae]
MRHLLCRVAPGSWKSAWLVGPHHRRFASAKRRKRVAAKSKPSDLVHVSPELPTRDDCTWTGQTTIGSALLHAHVIVVPGSAGQDYCDVVLDLAGHVEDSQRRAKFASSGLFPPSFVPDDSYWNDVASQIRTRFGKVAWFAVYDGHVTHKIARLAAHYTPYVLAKSIAEHHDNDLPVILKGLPREVHHIIKRQAIEGHGVDVRDAGGTTATMAVVTDRHVHIAAIGDSLGLIHTSKGYSYSVPQSMDTLPLDVEEEFNKANMLYGDLAGCSSYERKATAGRDNRVGITGLRMYGSIGDYHCDMDVVNAMVKYHKGDFDPNDPDVKMLCSLTKDHRAIWRAFVPLPGPFRLMSSDPFRREPDSSVSAPVDGTLSFILATDGVPLWKSVHLVESADPSEKVASLKHLTRGSVDDAALVYVELKPQTNHSEQ